MNKYIAFIIFILTIPVSYAYEVSENDKKTLEQFKAKALEIYNNNPQKAYTVSNNISIALENYSHPVAIYALNFIYDFTNDFINLLELPTLDNEYTGINENDIIFSIDKEIENQYSNLEKVDISDLNLISSFDIESNIDHIVLQNLYLENIGSIANISNLFGDIFLVLDNNLISRGYELNGFLNFDISDFIIKRNDFVKFYIYADIKEPVNSDQVGELILDFATPSHAKTGTLNGIKAISYSNGSDINSSVSISNQEKILIQKSSSLIGETDFNPSYNKAVEFTLSNNSRNRLEIESFKFRIHGSFLNHIGEDTKFILKRENSNQVFGTATKLDIIDNNLSITHNGNDHDFMSANTKNIYELEIRHELNPEGSREIRLQNIVIGDGFGGTIANLDVYSNSGLPSKWSNYRY